MELYAAVRRSVYVEVVERARGGAPASMSGPRDGDDKMLRYRLPPAVSPAEADPVVRSWPGHFTGVIDQILRDPYQHRPKKQRHTAKRHLASADARSTTSRAATRSSKPTCASRSWAGKRCLCRSRIHRATPRLDVGEALVVIDGVERIGARPEASWICRTATDAFVKAFPAETTEALNAMGTTLDVPLLRRRAERGFRIVYDNTKLAVARMLGDGTRQRTLLSSWRAPVARLCSTIASERPGKGNDKGKVEGLLGYARRNFFVPGPTLRQLGRVEPSTWTNKCRRTRRGRNEIIEAAHR